jgi:aldose 1-epimerase
MSKKVTFFHLQNNSLRVVLSNYGASIISIFVKDVNDNWVDVIVGPDTIDKQQYKHAKYYGSTIGRYANRIANAKFELNGKEYLLSKNEKENHLHGGFNGLDTKIWEVESEQDNAIKFTCVSVDGEEGYPANVMITCTFLLNDNSLQISYTAKADADTIFNITNHAYFNLNGVGDIVEHEICINADEYLPIDALCIPTGAFNLVDNTPFDFKTVAPISSKINKENEQLKYGNGYDHSFVLNKKNDNNFALAATAKGDISKIQLAVYTTEPSVHLYTGNFMQGLNVFKNEMVDFARTAFCFETQHFPNSPNNINFPTTILKKNELFTTNTHYTFSLSSSQKLTNE